MSKERQLSKSDYQVARTCATNLYYRKHGYPMTSGESGYMQMLADGGFIIGKMAKLLYPEGIEVAAETTAEAVAITKVLLKQENVVLFEAALESNGKVARVDILIKTGDDIEVIEVKAKSADSSVAGEFRGKAGVVRPVWRPYIEDVAFQVLLVLEQFPKAKVKAYLMMPDKSKTTGIDGLAGWFGIHRSEPGTQGRAGGAVDVIFTGDAEAVREERNNFLTAFDVTGDVVEEMRDVMRYADSYVAYLRNGMPQVQMPLGKHCMDCEFRATASDARNGFRDCWGELALPSPHVFDLYHVGTIGGTKDPLVNELIRAGKTSLYDVPTDRLGKDRGRRQLIQIERTRSGTEYFEGMDEVILKAVYPLHFIDFETSSMAVPYHAGMRPFETVAFQWSCHTIPRQGQEPMHTEWLNTEQVFPNAEFAEALMRQLGTTGTVLMWATHEQTVLKTIRRQLDRWPDEHEALKAWLDGMVWDIPQGHGKAAKTGTRILDMNRLVYEHYFHPLMKGSTSLKHVLPAVWANERLRAMPWLKKYVKVEQGRLLNPYHTLPALEIGGKAETIAEGTGAMRAYQDMMYGTGRLAGHEERERWKRLLLQYCALDTMAMVMVWVNWEMLVQPRRVQGKQ